MPVLPDDRDGHRYPEHARSSFAFGKAAAAGDGAHKDRLCRSRAEDRRACPACGTEQKAFHRRVRFGIRGHAGIVYPIAPDRHGVPAPYPHRPAGAGNRRALRVRQRILFQPDLFGQDRISADRIPKKLPKRIKNERVCAFAQIRLTFPTAGETALSRAGPQKRPLRADTLANGLAGGRASFRDGSYFSYQKNENKPRSDLKYQTNDGIIFTLGRSGRSGMSATAVSMGTAKGDAFA